MFKNLRTGTKLFILCGIFIVTVGVTTYGLVAEKLIAIDFARKELVGNRYSTYVKQVYAAVLTGKPLEAGLFEDGLSPALSDASHGRTLLSKKKRLSLRYMRFGRANPRGQT
jgi:hypothetical protein